MIYPIFSSHFSVNKSILILDDQKEIEKNSPVSIFAIGHQYQLPEIHLLDTNCSGYIEAYRTSKSQGIPFRFGLSLTVCNDMKDKSDASLKTESRINLWLVNDIDKPTFFKIFSKASQEGFYYEPRIDWTTLNEMLTENIIITIPFYSSFLHNNNLKRYGCIPAINDKTIFHVENHELPYDNTIKLLVEDYTSKYGNPIIESNMCYYYSQADCLAYQTYKCATNPGKRTTLDSPNLDGFGSDKFSFQHYCNLSNIPFTYAS